MSNLLPIVVVVLLALTWIVLGLKTVRQWETGILLRFGRFVGLRRPGFNLIIPAVDTLVKVSQRIVTIVLEPQEVITRDNVTIKVDAVVYFKVVDPAKAVIQVEDYFNATTQIALTTLRSVLGQSDLDELLAHREKINDRLKTIIDEQTEEPWGVKVTVAEVKDVLLSENMQTAMARQAEAESQVGWVKHARGDCECELGMPTHRVSWQAQQSRN